MSIYISQATIGDLEFSLRVNNPNTYWSMFRLADRAGFVIIMGFKVNNNMWSHEAILDERMFLVNGHRDVYKSIDKLLAQKETTRICVKFWTGVEIE